MPRYIWIDTIVRGQTKLDTMSKRTVEQKPSASGWNPELLAIKWMTNVEIVHLKKKHIIRPLNPPWAGLHWNFAQDVEVQIVILPKDTATARWLNDGTTKKQLWHTLATNLDYLEQPEISCHFSSCWEDSHLKPFVIQTWPLESSRCLVARGWKKIQRSDQLLLRSEATRAKDFDAIRWIPFMISKWMVDFHVRLRFLNVNKLQY